jgi:hypothetical protein
MGIGAPTLTEWHNRARASGAVAAHQGDQQGHRHTITDGEALRRFAAQHGDKPPAAMAQLWPAAISKETMGRALKRMGGTRKQSPIATPKANRKNAQPPTRHCGHQLSKLKSRTQSGLRLSKSKLCFLGAYKGL